MGTDPLRTGTMARSRKRVRLSQRVYFFCGELAEMAIRVTVAFETLRITTRWIYDAIAASLK